MSISPLFKRLNEIETQMDKPAVLASSERLDILDRSYDDAWNDIFNYSPQNSDLAELMLLMLLDKMADRAENGESVVQIREKIFDLFQSAHERTPQVEAKKAHFHANAGLV